MRIRVFIMGLLLMLSLADAFAQNRVKVTGYVRDADGNPLDLVNFR